MITITSTYTEFLFIEDSFEYTKTFENALTDFAKIQDNANLESYLTDLISHKKLMERNKPRRSCLKDLRGLFKKSSSSK
jgi:hypothetical protein